MERQLVKQGASTLMVSIPREWIEQQKLGKGDAVHIEQLNDKLVISAGTRQKQITEYTAHLSRPDYEETRSLLGLLYREGYSNIIITYDDPKSIYYLQVLSNTLPGFEIIEQSDHRCVIKNAAVNISLTSQEIMSRVINVIKTMFIMAREYLGEGVKGKDEEMRILRDENWKLLNLLYVQLKNQPLFSAHEDYFMLQLLEYNGTYLYWMYRAFNSGRHDIKKATPAFIKLLQETSNYFTTTVKKMHIKDKGILEYLIETRRRLLRECETYANTRAPDRFLIIFLSMLVQNIHNPKNVLYQ